MTAPPGQAVVNREHQLADGIEAQTIQPHGCLLVCTMPGWVIMAGSQNCNAMLGLTALDVLGASLDGVLPHQLVHDLRNVLQTAMGSGRTEHLLNVGLDGVGRFDLALHIAGHQAVLEFVPRSSETASVQDSSLLVRSMTGRLARAPTLERCLSLAANQVRAVTGFDRVIVSKLAADDTGQVVTEALRTGLPSFLGLRYRISDLPPADQALFRRAGLRLVPDTDYKPVPILRMSEDTEVPDLALSILRGVDPERLADLRTLGARAAMTIPLVDGNRLWGLLTCHHSAPRSLPTSVATLLDLFGQVLSMQIALKEADGHKRAADTAKSAAERLAELLPLADELVDDFPRLAQLMRDLIPCDGVGLWSKGAWVGVGLNPTTGEREALLLDLVQDPSGPPVVATDRLSPDSPGGESGVCGCMLVRLRRQRPDALVFFRGETVETLVWGLDPHRSRGAGANSSADPGDERREELRRGRCVAWRPAELETADRIRVALLEALLDRAE